MHHLFGCWLSCALIWWGNNVKHSFIHIYKTLAVHKRWHASILVLDTAALVWHTGRQNCAISSPPTVTYMWEESVVPWSRWTGPWHGRMARSHAERRVAMSRRKMANSHEFTVFQMRTRPWNLTCRPGLDGRRAGVEKMCVLSANDPFLSSNLLSEPQWPMKALRRPEFLRATALKMVAAKARGVKTIKKYYIKWKRDENNVWSLSACLCLVIFSNALEECCALKGTSMKLVCHFD